MAGCAVIFWIFTLCIVCIYADTPSVSSRLGLLYGDKESVTFQGKTYTVDRYFGIPYAKPPVGDLRFKKPEPYGVFSEPFNAVKVPPSCPQLEYDLIKLSGDEISEDCLFLNVYVPKQDPDRSSGHAVLFFIHGGAFAVGTSSTYRSEVLASVGNVIVVTVNYRLGLLGFLNIRDDRARGNFGLYDQHLALKWVNQNIKAFGGDKERVTILGESAGSISVSLQMLYPPNKGLFTAAIAESGTMTMPLLFKDDTVEAAYFYAENMSCSVETKDDVLECLLSASSEDLLEVTNVVKNDPTLSMKLIMGPTIDGEFIRMRPSELMKRSQFEILQEVEFLRSINLLNGVNGAEGGSFVATITGDIEEFGVTREEMNTQQVPNIAAMKFGFDTNIPNIVQKFIEYEYTDWTNPDDPKWLRQQMVKAYGDVFFGVPGIELSRLHANGSNAGSYFYIFDAFLDLHLIQTPKWVGKANHGDELNPVFGYNFDLEDLINKTGYIAPDWELELSTRIMTYWSNFAKSGNPNIPVPCPLEWPRYNLETQQYIILDREDSTGKYVYARELQFWNNLCKVYEELTHAQTISSEYAKDDEGTCEKDGTCG